MDDKAGRGVITRSIVAVGLIVVGLAAAPVHATERTVTKQYAGPTVVAPPACYTSPALSVTGAGGACFEVEPGDGSVRLETVDVAWPYPVGTLYAFRLASGALTPIDDFCGVSGEIVVPDTATLLVVSTDLLANLHCSPSIAMTGTITATFTSVAPAVSGRQGTEASSVE